MGACTSRPSDLLVSPVVITPYGFTATFPKELRAQRRHYHIRPHSDGKKSLIPAVWFTLSHLWDQTQISWDQNPLRFFLILCFFLPQGPWKLVTSDPAGPCMPVLAWGF